MLRNLTMASVLVASLAVTAAAGVFIGSSQTTAQGAFPEEYFCREYHFDGGTLSQFRSYFGEADIEDLIDAISEIVPTGMRCVNPR